MYMYTTLEENQTQAIIFIVENAVAVGYMKKNLLNWQVYPYLTPQFL